MYSNNKTHSILAVAAMMCLMLFASIQLSSSAAIKPRATKKDVPKITGNFQPITDDKNEPKSINCFCNLPECGEQMKCSTVFGCFSELQPVLSDVENRGPASILAELRKSEDFDGEAKTFPMDNNHGSNDSYGCLDLLTVNKTCVQILQSMEGDGSEFPSLPKPAVHENIMRAYKCCDKDMCNEQRDVNANEKPVHSLSSTQVSADTADAASSATTSSSTAIAAVTTSSPSSSAAEDNVTATVDTVGGAENATSALVTADSGDYAASSKISNDTAAASYNDSTVATSDSAEHDNFTSSASSSNNDTTGVTVTAVDQFADNVTADSTQEPVTITVNVTTATAADHDNATNTTNDVAAAYGDNAVVMPNSTEHNNSVSSSSDVTTVVAVAGVTTAADRSDNATAETTQAPAVVVAAKADLHTTTM